MLVRRPVHLGRVPKFVTLCSDASGGRFRSGPGPLCQRAGPPAATSDLRRPERSSARAPEGVGFEKTSAQAE
jgi:hypothetical protein